MQNTHFFKQNTPDSVGIPANLIDNLMESLTEAQIKLHSLLILKDDTLICEKYFAPYDENKLHRMFSLTKTLTAIAIGLLADEGKISLDDKIVPYFPEYTSADTHEYLQNMTIRDMLMMRTCYNNTTYNKFDIYSGWTKSYFIAKPTHPSGLCFHYDTSSPHVLCALIEKLTGMPTIEYVKSKFSSLNLSESSYVIADGDGVSMGGTGLMCTSMDLCKLGYLLLKKGNINGEQLLSSKYIEEITTFHTDTRAAMGSKFEKSGYGMQIWMHGANGYCGYGMGGQFINVYPDMNMVVITTADTIGHGSGIQLIQDSINRDFVAKLRKSAMSQPTIDEGSISSAPLYAPNIKVDNKIHTLSFPLNGENISIQFGMGCSVESKIPFYDMNGYATGDIWAEDEAGTHLYIKVDIVDECIGSLHFDVTLLSKEKAMELSHGKTDNGVFIYMNKIEESMFDEYKGPLLFLNGECSFN